MAETEPLIRQWTLLRILSARRNGVSYLDLVREAGAVRRTIQRDLALLTRLGFPLQEFTGEHRQKFWRIDGDAGLAQLQFTLEEAAALYLGRQFLEPLAGTLFHSGAQSAYTKIRATLGHAAIRHLEKLAAGFYCTRQAWVDYGDKGKLIDDLSLAVEERRLTVITYQSLRTTEPVTLYDVFPYALVHHRNALYVIAYSRDHDQIRTFKVDRISSVDTHELKFPPPDGFDVQAFLESSFGIFEGQGDPVLVRVSFRASVSRILSEKRFHSSQTLIPQLDGSVIAEFRLSTFEEFLSWILSFGPEAEVLSPESLRETIQGKLADSLNRYQQKSTQTKPHSEPGEDRLTAPRREARGGVTTTTPQPEPVEGEPPSTQHKPRTRVRRPR